MILLDGGSKELFLFCFMVVFFFCKGAPCARNWGKFVTTQCFCRKTKTHDTTTPAASCPRRDKSYKCSATELPSFFTVDCVV